MAFDSTKRVNIGQSANDRQGDNLRTAFNKINNNFSELYTALGLDSDTSLNLGAFEFTGSTISTTDSTPITIDPSVTIASDLTVGGDVVPSTDFGSSLGSATKRFKDLFLSGDTITLGNETIKSDTGKIILSGSVEASTLTVTSLNATNVSGSFAGSFAGAVNVKTTSDSGSDILAEGDTMTVGYLTIKIEQGDGVRANSNENELFVKYSNPSASTTISITARDVAGIGVLPGSVETRAAGNNTYSFVPTVYSYAGAPLWVEIMDHTNNKFYRISTVAKTVNDGAGTPGSIYATIETLR